MFLVFGSGEDGCSGKTGGWKTACLGTTWRFGEIAELKRVHGHGRCVGAQNKRGA